MCWALLILSRITLQKSTMITSENKMWNERRYDGDYVETSIFPMKLEFECKQVVSTDPQ